MTPIPTSPIRRVGLLLAVQCGMTFSLSAADSSWNSAVTSGAWNNDANWSANAPGVTGNSGTNADIATINQTANTAISLNEDWSVGGLALANASGTTTSLQGTGTFYLGSAGTISRTGGDATSGSILDLNLRLTGDYTIQSDGTGYVDIGTTGSTIQSSAISGNQTLVLRGASTSSSNVVDSVISNGSTGGTVVLRKTDAGTWKLTTANSYTGGTIIGGATGNTDTAGGILTVAASGALGTGTVTIRNNSASAGGRDGGTLQLTGDSSITNAIALTTFRSIATSYHIQNLSGNNSIGAVTLGTGTTASAYRFDSAAGKLDIASITPPGTSSGNFRIITFSGAGDFNIVNGVVQGPSTGTAVRVNKGGTGTLTYASGSSNTNGGQTNLTAGTLLINGSYSTSNVITNNATLSGYGNSSSGQFLVGSSATLGGSGQISGNTTLANSNLILVQSGGIFAPGASAGAIGTLTLSGTAGLGTTSKILNLASGAKLAFDLSGNSNTADRIDLWGYNSTDRGLALNSNVIDFTLTGTLISGDYSIDLFRFYSDAGITLTASDIASGLIIGTYDATHITSIDLVYGTDKISLNYTVLVPEPSTWMLLVTACFLTAGVVLRRRHHQP